METQTRPEVRTLDPRDVQAILARNITGRIAFEAEGEIEVLPVSYVQAGDFIYLRSSGNGRLAATDSGARVGFEVDEIQSTRQWRSVVVRGTLLRIDREGEQEEWMRAVGKLRRLMPGAFRDRDALSHRDTIFRVLIREASGRAAGS